MAPFVLPRAYGQRQARGKGNVPKQEHIVIIIIAVVIVIVIVIIIVIVIVIVIIIVICVQPSRNPLGIL